MTDPTRLLVDWRDAVIGRYRAINDPVDRHEYAKRLTAEADQLVTFAADMAARAAAELHVDGWSYARIAQALGVSRSRAQQLVERGREVAIRLSTEP